MSNIVSISTTVLADDPLILVDFLAVKSGISKSKIKDAVNKGALQFKRKGQKSRRLRKVKFKLKPKDFIDFNYDSSLLPLIPNEPELILDTKRYSCWNKPAGLLSQGTKFSDHCSILRRVELFYKGLRQVYLVHRLDREAAGLICIAHDKEAAAKLSKLFKDRHIEKTYQVEVLGDLNKKGKSSSIDLELDNKQAITNYKQISFSKESNSSTAIVTLEGGRFHQIRRHFAAIDHPVIGDPKYGKNNKNNSGLKLQATGLKFVCPFTGSPIELKL